MRIQILPRRKFVIIFVRCVVEREECRTAMRGGASGCVDGGMSYFSSLWRDCARGMVCVNTRKGKRMGVLVDVPGGGWMRLRRPVSLPGSVEAKISLWVIVGREVSLRPIMTRRRGGGGCWSLVFSYLVVRVSVAISSMLEPIVADQREVWREGFVRADQMDSVCVRKRGSMRTSASSRMRVVMLGSGSGGEAESLSASSCLRVMAWRRESGVETRMSDLTILSRVAPSDPESSESLP